MLGAGEEIAIKFEILTNERRKLRETVKIRTAGSKVSGCGNVYRKTRAWRFVFVFCFFSLSMIWFCHLKLTELAYILTSQVHEVMKL